MPVFWPKKASFSCFTPYPPLFFDLFWPFLDLFAKNPHFFANLVTFRISEKPRFSQKTRKTPKKHQKTVKKHENSCFSSFSLFLENLHFPFLPKNDQKRQKNTVFTPPRSSREFHTFFRAPSNSYLNFVQKNVIFQKTRFFQKPPIFDHFELFLTFFRKTPPPGTPFFCFFHKFEISQILPKFPLTSVFFDQKTPPKTLSIFNAF